MVEIANFVRNIRNSFGRSSSLNPQLEETLGVIGESIENAPFVDEKQLLDIPEFPKSSYQDLASTFIHTELERIYHEHNLGVDQDLQAIELLSETPFFRGLGVARIVELTADEHVLSYTASDKLAAVLTKSSPSKRVEWILDDFEKQSLSNSDAPLLSNQEEYSFDRVEVISNIDEPSKATSSLRREIVLVGLNKESALKDGEELMRAIKRTKSEIAPEIIAEVVDYLANEQPLRAFDRYGERVKWGPYKGWNIVKKGSAGRILFTYQRVSLLVRLGDHYSIYGTGKFGDSSRSL